MDSNTDRELLSQLNAGHKPSTIVTLPNLTMLVITNLIIEMRG